MIPNRVIFLILLTLCALTASAQEHLSFRPDTWDFGTIRETDGRVSHTFTGVNRGDSPLVILDVVTTCGCTVPDFSKKPILPGEKELAENHRSASAKLRILEKIHARNESIKFPKE